MNTAVETKDILNTDLKDWALKLYSKSPLKQAKVKAITTALEAVGENVCLDLGSDNGVVSFLLRKLGGTWSSADLTDETTEAIRSLVGERVFKIDGTRLPFKGQEFDVVVIVDMLEHLEDDQALINQIYDCLKPGGSLVINVPNPKPGFLRSLQLSIGQTDEMHGHVRPGYDLPQLKKLFGAKFEVEYSQAYVRFFGEAVNTLIRFGVDLLKGQKKADASSGDKGAVMTASDLGKLQKSFRLYSLIYPFMWAAMKLDYLIPWAHGHMLVVRARKI